MKTASTASFAERPLREELKAALAANSFQDPTPVQAACLDETSPGDLLVQARTGSGKTLAFGIPILERLDPQNRFPQALVLAPTRELALQISKALSPLAKALDARCLALTGGAELGPQLKALASPRGAQVVIGTPGRVLDLLNRGSLSPKDIMTVVLDEGDHLLDLGFKDELDAIIAFTREDRRTLLFSATIHPEVDALARRHMKDPRRITIDKAESQHADIEHLAYAVPEGQKAEALANLIFFEQPERTVVFANTRQAARELSERLPLLGIPAGFISGELDQKARNRALDAFREGRCHVLVATDVAARGIDVPATTHVVHFSLADKSENYLHRSGRTGRAGRKGVAISLVTGRERTGFARLIRTVGVKIHWKDVPGPGQIARSRIQRLATRVMDEAGSDEERSPHALELAHKLANGLAEGESPVALLARLLDLAAQAEGEPGFDLDTALKAEAARPAAARRNRDDRKVPRHERWARRDAGARPAWRSHAEGAGHGRPGEPRTRVDGGAGHAGKPHGAPAPHGKPAGHGKPHGAPPAPHGKPAANGKPHGKPTGKPFERPAPGGKPWQKQGGHQRDAREPWRKPGRKTRPE